LGSGGSPAVNKDSVKVMKSFNTFWGLTRFQRKQLTLNSILQFALRHNPAGQQHTAFQHIEFVALIFEFKENDSTTPYYMVAAMIYVRSDTTKTIILLRHVSYASIMTAENVLLLETAHVAAFD
jgi:hypothetical protein